MRPLRPRYTRRARRQLDAIHNYIAERNPKAADRVVARIREAVQLLAEFPFIGHQSIVPNSQEFVVIGLPYIIVYRPAPRNPDILEVLAIFHGAQDRLADERG